MAKVVELKDSAKGHLEALAAEIATLIGHAKPGTQVSPTMKSWTSNTQDVNVALTVLQAVRELWSRSLARTSPMCLLGLAISHGQILYVFEWIMCRAEIPLVVAIPNFVRLHRSPVVLLVF